jgi:predicted transposase/invertase (TIGR01784 family)
MKRYLDPKNDLPFKRIFGEHPDLLKSFLNALMPLEENQHIESLKYLAAEQVPNNPAKKNSIVDVRCKDNHGRQFIVEMQMYWNNYFSNRMVFNASKAFVRQLNSGEDYELLQPVYGLGIINDIFDRETSEYYHHYKTINYNNNRETIKGLEFVMIELPKFKPISVTEKKMTVLWLRFLKEIEDDKYIEPAPELLKNKYIRQAIEICEEGAYTEAELYAYERYWDAVSIEKSLLTGREKGKKEGREEGLAEGIEKGKKEGREEGLSEGIEKGKKEGREEGLSEGIEKGREKGLAEGMEKIVIKSFKNGFSFENISSITDLPVDEVISMLQRHKLIE